MTYVFYNMTFIRSVPAKADIKTYILKIFTDMQNNVDKLLNEDVIFILDNKSNLDNNLAVCIL